MSNTIDLTKGKVARQLLSFSLPLIITNFLQTIHLMLDALLVGRALGVNAIGAVAVGGQSILFFTTVSMGIAAGGQILIARYRGAKDSSSQEKVQRASLFLALCSGITLTILAYFGAPFFLSLLNTPADTLEDAIRYMQLLSLGLIFTFLYQAVAGILRGLGNAKQALIFAGVATGLHLLLGIVLVFVFSFGILGAAVSAVVGQAIATVYSLWFVQKKIVQKESFKRKQYLPELKTCIEIIKVGLPFGLQMGVLHLANIFIIRLIAPFGTAAVSALGVSARVTNVLTLPMMAIGNGASSIIGQSLGAEKPKRVKETIFWTKIYTLIFISITTALTLLLPRQLLQFFTNDQNAIEIGVIYLSILAFAYLAHALHSIFNAPLLASGKSKYSLYAAGAEGILGRILLTWLFSNIWGLYGIFVAQLLSVYLGSLVIWLAYRHCKLHKIA